MNKLQDVVIVSGARLPVASFGGSLKTVNVIDMGAMVVREAAKPTYDWFRETYPEIDLDHILESVAKYNEMYPGSDKDVK